MSSTACWPWPSPTCCAARPTTPACTCRSASCWPSWPASRKPCCSTTTAAKAAPGLGACSPTWTPPNSAWPTCSTSTATHRPADHAHTGELGNTPTPPAHTVLPAETPSTINEGRKLTLGARVGVELPRVRAQADRVDLALALVADPGLDHVGGEDVALEHEGVVLLQRVERLVQRAGDLRHRRQLLGRQLVEVLVERAEGLDLVADPVQAGHQHGRER